MSPFMQTTKSGFWLYIQGLKPFFYTLNFSNIGVKVSRHKNFNVMAAAALQLLACEGLTNSDPDDQPDEQEPRAQDNTLTAICNGFFGVLRLTV